jgi:ER lumen protein retaining receptor
MTSVYARTREREKAWKFGLYCLAGSIVITPLWFIAFRYWIHGPVFLQVRCYFQTTNEASADGVIDTMGLL